jgi:hypothetical protein
MQIAIKILKHYTIGIITALFIIAIIHLYSSIFEPYFISARWNNIIQASLISGFPFGIASWAFINLKLQNDSRTKNRSQSDY